MPARTKNTVTIKNGTAIDTQVESLFRNVLSQVRESISDNPYIGEALRVLGVQGYRSAIGCYWNAVIDDMRNKVIFRSLHLFNKEMKQFLGNRELKTYEDFQNYVTDENLIEGAYKIGVIGWEAHKMLRHAKETRHIFDGHPRSSDPDLIKVLNMINDCNKYVLQVEYPQQIINIDDYIANMGLDEFDRNEIGIKNALECIPDTYKNELIQRLFTSYVHKDAGTVLKSNIELVVPILWNFLSKETKIAVVRRVDQEISKGNVVCTENAFNFVKLVSSLQYLSHIAKEYKISPLLENLKRNLDNWQTENTVVRELFPYAPYIPRQLLKDYVKAITESYVGCVGTSSMYTRTDFYADGAAVIIPKMFQKFDDESALAFIETIKNSSTLKSRITHTAKLARLRTLANIVRERVSETFPEKDILDALVDDTREKEFLSMTKN